jgi:hypothetical protein
MLRTLLGFLAATSGCAGADPGTLDDTGRFGGPLTPMVSRADIERDLELVLEVAAQEPLTAERAAEDLQVFRATVVNHSPARAYGLVAPSDGSERGLRDPRTWFTLEKSADGEHWEAVRELSYATCGLYDEDWEDEVVTVEPGGLLTFSWFPFFMSIWDLSSASELRVTGHYALDEVLRDRSKLPPALHATPAFALESNQVEVSLEPTSAPPPSEPTLQP